MIMKATLSTQTVQWALDNLGLHKDSMTKYKIEALLAKATEMGAVRRLSHTQAQWKSESSLQLFKQWVVNYVKDHNGEMPTVEY